MSFPYAGLIPAGYGRQKLQDERSLFLVFYPKAVDQAAKYPLNSALGHAIREITCSKNGNVLGQGASSNASKDEFWIPPADILSNSPLWNEREYEIDYFLGVFIFEHGGRNWRQLAGTPVSHHVSYDVAKAKPCVERHKFLF